MNIETKFAPAYTLAVCHLQPGEALRVESGAMVDMDSNLSMETGFRAGKGGILKGIARSMLGGESFFQNTFRATNGAGTVRLAPGNVGDLRLLDLAGDLFIQSSCFVASAESIDLTTKLGGFKNWFGGKGLFMLKASGQGPLLISAFGAIHEVPVNGQFTVDTGHIVAFDPTLDFSIRRAGSWFSTFFSGEGFVCRFSGHGRLFIQTRNPGEFGGRVGPFLPPRQG